ncbi:hypothetical protein BCT62_14250 [Vibrio splendidus]|nr:hypothetical protein BCT62_14250 [Vibrio splendidus]
MLAQSLAVEIKSFGIVREQPYGSKISPLYKPDRAGSPKVRKATLERMKEILETLRKNQKKQH